MNKKVKNLWVKALRSGEFHQGKGYLEKEGRYCALGVLSVLALIEGQCTYNTEGDLGKFDNKKFSLSFNVMRWAQIAQAGERYLDSQEQKVKICFRGKTTTLADLNDEGLTFSQIANLIEKFL